MVYFPAFGMMYCHLVYFPSFGMLHREKCGEYIEILGLEVACIYACRTIKNNGVTIS
jgi:hypothetical protein